MSEARRCELAIAFDFESASEFWASWENFSALPFVAKLGMRLLPHLGPSDYKRLSNQGQRFFVDAKLMDIPSQVEASVRSYSELGASYLTVHLMGGEAMLRAASDAARGSGLTLLGVSVLTSFDDKELKSIGVDSDCSTQVGRLLDLGLSSGIRGFVSSVAEAPLIKGRAQDSVLCCPGIRLSGESSHADQKRSFTPQDALKAGVDLMVVGRSIQSAANPRQQAEKILEILSDSNEG